MTDPDYIAENTWCPECSKDFTTGDCRAVMRYCSKHPRSLEGDKDNHVEFDMQYPGMVAGGQEARDLCDMIHKGKNGRRDR